MGEKMFKYGVILLLLAAAGFGFYHVFEYLSVDDRVGGSVASVFVVGCCILLGKVSHWKE